MLDRVRKLLDDIWSQISEHTLLAEKSSEIPSEIVAAIDRSINAKIKTYRYVLPTQLLAKLADRSLDCRAIQKGSNLPNSFDARSLCHEVIVPFDRANHNVLGGSTEPYANNPLRIPSITPAFRKPQKDKAGFDDLCEVLAYAQAHPKQAKLLMTVVLGSIGRRLGSTHVVYPVPNRISLHGAQSALNSYVVERTGGVRLQVIAVALFKAIGRHLGMFEEVKSAAVNASDASTGLVADLSCIDAENRVVLAVEIKDRKLTLRHVQDKLPGVRELGIRELLFLVRGGLQEEDEDGIRNAVDREFAVGHNIYVCEFDAFVECCLILFGEDGRRGFLIGVGTSLDDIGADITHRQAWSDLLERL
ncbi:MAG: restriction endonuclease, SacI family [Phycisphaerales bacterium]|nr:restriction endonuclease, SacI family [Phycisphaerales bacterium]